MTLLSQLPIGARTAPNRVMFGPHVTNLGDDARAFTDRHVAYYERRARGGCGIIVTEGASVHPSDWPYERAPLATSCADGWRDISDACHVHGSLVIASLDHAGGQGSSAYSQLPLWAPSRVPEVNTREVPKWMEADDIAAVITGFGDAAAVAVSSGCDGVEVNAGQHSLVRQFMSGLTNHRGDEYADRLLFARRVIETVRARVGRDHVVGLRLSCDELAPWAGITPEMAPAIASELTACGLDYTVVVRGSIFSAEKTRPDFHEPTGFNIDTCRAVRAAVASSVVVFLQGSIVDAGQAEWAVTDRVCDGVEMTRAQIADPDLVNKTAAGDAVRPCVLCNQTCQVRDARNPIVTCIGEPSSGHEVDDPQWLSPARNPRRVLVIGAGVAGLEAARVAASRGHSVRVVERDARVGGLAAVSGPAARLVGWLESETRRLGVQIETGVDGLSRLGDSDVVIQATGGTRGVTEYSLEGVYRDDIIDIAELRRGRVQLPADGPVVIIDPIGGPIAVALAEELGARAILVTQDNIAGNELSRSGDLAPANVRLAQKGVTVERRTLVRAVSRNEREFVVRVQDRFSGETRQLTAAAVVDCGFRLPTEPIDRSMQIGDAVAPRTVYEAVLEARRAALSI